MVPLALLIRSSLLRVRPMVPKRRRRINTMMEAVYEGWVCMYGSDCVVRKEEEIDLASWSLEMMGNG